MKENMFLDWLNRRKISDAVIREFDIHWGENPTLGDCIVIPIKNSEGVFSFNKYRRNPLDKSTPKYIYDQGGKVTLYGLDKIKDKKTVLITEGEMDCLVAWSANIPAITSTGGAMSFQKEWVELLKDKDVVLCFDNDEAGGAGMAKVFDFLPQAKILFLPDRPGVKDISDYVTNGGDLVELMRTARGFESVEDVVENRAERTSVWQSTWFHDAYIKNHTKPTFLKKDRKEEKDKVLRAKSYPIPDLIELNKNKACCLWHNEKEPSLTYYPKTNTLYCFGGCGRAYDAIDVYRHMHGCSFGEAVKKLQ